MIRSESMKSCLAAQKRFMLLFNFLFALFPHKFVLWVEALRQDWAESGKLELPKMGNLELKLWKMHCLAWAGRDNYEEDTLQSSLQFVPKTPKVKFSESQSLELDINVANALLLSLSISSPCVAVGGFVIRVRIGVGEWSHSNGSTKTFSLVKNNFCSMAYIFSFSCKNTYLQVLITANHFCPPAFNCKSLLLPVL